MASHEWIYRFIAADQRAGGELYHRRKRYRKRYGSHERRGQLRNRVSISERLGDLEGDTVHGVGSNLVTLVDRKSGYLSAYPVKRRTRRQVTRVINLLLIPIRPGSVAPMKMPTACSDSISPRAATSAS